MMIEKLRKKIFWSIECSALAVLFLILAAYNIVQYIGSEQDDWHLLSMMMDASYESRDPSADGVEPAETGSDGAVSGEGTDFKETVEQGRNGYEGADGSEKFRGMEDDLHAPEKEKWWLRIFGLGAPEKTGDGRPPEKKIQRDRGNRGTARMVSELMSGKISCVGLDDEGTMESVSGFLETYEEAEREELIARILSGGKQRGRIGAMKYLCRTSAAGSDLVLMNAGYLNSDEASLLLFSLLGLVLSGGIFALIARRIAISIVRPVEETMTSRKQFIADASHELKTPVAVMMANIAVLEKEIGRNKWMDYIKEEGKRMSDLTGSLLLLSRLDYEQDEVGTGQRDCEFDLSDAVLETALPFESVAFEQGIVYELEAEEKVSARGNAEEIKQIVGILTDNALKHAGPMGRVEIRVQTEELRKGRKTIRHAAVHVTNTGEEISEEVLPYIFDRFYKADTARAYQENSFGLGLAIAKSLSEKNGGEILVRSENGETDFTLLLRVGQHF